MAQRKDAVMARQECSAELRRSWLVQRLKRPATGRAGAIAEAFSFGGGLHRGGLSDDAAALLRQAFSFDYMGAAEFEWGAVPEALQMMAGAQERLTAFALEVPLSEVQAGWQERKHPAPPGTGTVYVLTQDGHAGDVEKRIRKWAAGPNDLKEPTRLSSALRPVNEWDADTCGWLELDNGFMFFTDEQMWRTTCRLFGVEAAS